MKIEKLNGGYSDSLNVGDIVTPKPEEKSRPEFKGWAELTVRAYGDRKVDEIWVAWRAADGKTCGETPVEALLLTSHSELQALAQLESIREMVKAFKDAEAREANSVIGDQIAIETAREAIQEDPLSVQVRGGWVDAAFDGDLCNPPVEFQILLCTGGPAVRIIGELNEHCEPENARLEHQDWGTPWTELRLSAQDQETLLEYSRQFYFGD